MSEKLYDTRVLCCAFHKHAGTCYDMFKSTDQHVYGCCITVSILLELMSSVQRSVSCVQIITAHQHMWRGAKEAL